MFFDYNVKNNEELYLCFGLRGELKKPEKKIAPEVKEEEELVDPAPQVTIVAA